MKRKHANDKHAHYVFTTVADMKHLPRHLIRPFCTDLMLWLMTPHILKEHGLKAALESDVFEWVNDGRHKVSITVNINHAPESL